MTVLKPGNYLDWVPDGNPSYVQNPTSGQKTTGWVFNEAPPMEYMNWLFYYTDQWIQWFDQTLTPGAGGINALALVLTTTGGIVLNSFDVTVSGSTTGIALGQIISGTAIPANSYVLAINGSVITMSRAATATVASETILFSHAFALGSNIQTQLDQLDSAAFAQARQAGGYNKIVGTSGILLLSSANIQAGDTILVIADITEAAQILVSVDDVRIDFMPGKRLLSTVTGATALKVTGNRFRSRDMRIRLNGAMTSGFSALELSGNDGSVTAGYLELNNGSIALTNAITLGGARNEISSSLVATLGSYTNPYTDGGTNNDSRIRG